VNDRDKELTNIQIGIELSDEDIYDAMSHISGYVDITTEDFREIYHLAFKHAVESLVGRLCARDIMTPDLPALGPETALDEAAGIMAGHGLKTIPVVDRDNTVIGVVSEADYLKRLGVDTFMAFLIKLLDDPEWVCDECHETHVETVMSAPPITVQEDADFQSLMQTFKAHPVRGVPVVDTARRLKGVIARKDFISAWRLEMGL